MLRGDKTIPYSSIVAVQFKRARLLPRYIQPTIKGGHEAKAGLFQSTQDENTINFYSNRNKDFEENDIAPNRSVADELKDKGILTEEEFKVQKDKILNQ